MKLVLLGYMGCGKSTIGKAIANELQLKFVDLDAFIEEKENASVATIFEKKGEIYFRKIEAIYLKELMNDTEHPIVSVGGGTPCYGENMEVIQLNSTSFFLKAGVSTLYERLKNEMDSRPLIQTIGLENLQEFMAKHLFERAFFYNRAQHELKIDDKSIDTVVKEIKALLNLDTQWQHRF
ncbi:MAG: shikimate kinase [Flavobacteriaceae bacterium]|nr:MAG: shikimate kinase [Flavobacteriaceae bacterium]